MSAPDIRELSLIVPGLFGPVPPAGVDTDAAVRALVSDLDLSPVETLLSRARMTPQAGAWESPEDLLFTAFGYRKPAGDWPAAAVARVADIGSDEGAWCLRADPVHMKADIGDLVLFDGDHFALDLEQANALAEIIAEHFSEAGWRLEVAHPLRWYLELDTPARIETTPLSMARLQNVDPYLPGGEEAGRWHGILNETQMLLHECAVNRQREARGEPAVNSLWFWGGGELPPPPPTSWSEVHGDSALLWGLAQRAGISSRTVPQDAEVWLKSAAAGRHLVLIEKGHAAARSGNIEAWREFIVDLSVSWFKPLLRALDGGRVKNVTVLTDRKLRYDAGRGRWWQRLNRSQSFARLAQG